MARRRSRVGRVALGLLVAIVVANESVTRGFLTDGYGHPVRGADVWLAESTHVVHRVRTDAAGYFRVTHAPFARRGYRLLICEGRSRMWVDTTPGSALVRSEYGIDVDTGRFPDVPADHGWVAEVPSSCPTKLVPPAG